MDIGMIGLGKMGGNMRERLRRSGHTVIGFDRNPEVSDVASLDEMVAALPTPKVVWVMVPAGEPTQGVIEELKGLLQEGDVVVDGGNSRWTDDTVNAESLGEKGIGFVDCGVSGGVWGLDNGYALMCGGCNRRRQGPAGLRRPEAGQRLRFRPRRHGRRRPLREDDPQRHRVRHHAVLRRGLGAAREREGG